MAPVSLDGPDVPTTAKKTVQSDAKGMNFPSPPLFGSKYAERAYKLERLAAAFRIFGKMGFEEGISGHMTLRDPVFSDCFWVNPLGLSFSLMTVSDLLLVNKDGEIIAGGKPDRQIYNQSAFDIHHAIHLARPDVNAACHAHSLYGKAFSAFGRGIDLLCQDACAFFEDLAVYPQFGGVVLSGGEGAQIAEYLGDCKAVLLQNHGPLTVGETIESAVAWYIALERLCHVQLLVDAAMAGRGQPPKMIGVEEAAFTRSVTGTETAGWNGAQVYFQTIEVETEGAYKA